MIDLNSAVEDARAIFHAALDGVQADRLLAGVDWAAAAPEPLDTYRTIRVVGMGKAAMAMASIVERALGSRIAEGVAVVPEGYPDTLPARYDPPTQIDIRTGGHPVPTEASREGARRIRSVADRSKEDNLLIVLVSGGGSALITDPVDGVSLEEAQAAFRLLLESGADIHAINAVRKHLTRLGGGQLARAAHPADVCALVISDVVGNNLATIASGPTVPDPTTFDDAVGVLRQYGLWDDVPAAVQNHLDAGRNGDRLETLKPDDPVFEYVRTHLIGTNRDALAAAQEKAEALGYRVQIEETEVTGEARTIGRRQAEVLLQQESAAPACLLWGGETTVTVQGDGVGGRNQEVALAAAPVLAQTDRPAVLLSGGTDGIDGPTDAAGAWATPETMASAQRHGLDPQRHLNENNAYPFFRVLDALLKPGPTHTNVMDVQIGLIGA